MVKVLESHDEHVASGAKLYFLDFFPSFQGYVSIRFKFFRLNIHKLNFVSVNYDDLIAARVECDRLSFLTGLVHVMDL